ncbi:unnamed protein product [Bursaphelenchus okinawaensis]|uniref:Protein kinase domain-containing protein n=1 Tax=Bursaphelenchus okinawaensis TaxID=465554 RepID=A0A811KLZ2_9BILA|nr:unnamed protein product [Bursaphelenchus okinawaensis]CAG9106059.1 unnamed protein product [Bursaphelenchus okinawaensis]
MAVGAISPTPAESPPPPPPPSTILPVGSIVTQDYKILEHLKSKRGNFLYRATSDKPFKDEFGNVHSEVIFKVAPPVNAAEPCRELLVLNFIKTYRCPNRLNRILMPINMVLDNYNRMLAFPAYYGSLADAKLKNGVLPQSTTLRIGLEMLAAIKELHGLGLVHQCIDPTHFLLPNVIDVNEHKFDIKLCDLSSAKNYIVYEDETPVPKKDVGVPMADYASVEVCDGGESCRRDDLVAWYYTMISLRGKLIWEDVQYGPVAQMRKSDWRRKPLLMAGCFCQDINMFITEIFLWIDDLENKDKPNYYALAKNIQTSLYLLDGIKSKNEDMPIVAEMKKDEFVEAVDKCTPRHSDYAEMFPDNRYEIQFLFSRAQNRMMPEIKAIIDEHITPYRFSEDEQQRAIEKGREPQYKKQYARKQKELEELKAKEQKEAEIDVVGEAGKKVDEQKAKTTTPPIKEAPVGVKPSGKPKKGSKQKNQKGKKAKEKAIKAKERASIMKDIEKRNKNPRNINIKRFANDGDDDETDNKTVDKSEMRPVEEAKSAIISIELPRKKSGQKKTPKPMKDNRTPSPARNRDEDNEISENNKVSQGKIRSKTPNRRPKEDDKKQRKKVRQG